MVELVARSTMAPFSLPCPVTCGWSTVYTLGGAGGCQGVAGGPYLAWLVHPTSKKTPVTSTECCKLERMPRPAAELGMSDTKDFERH